MCEKDTYFHKSICVHSGWNPSVSMYFRLHPDPSRGEPNLLKRGYRVLQRSKTAVASCLPPTIFKCRGCKWFGPIPSSPPLCLHRHDMCGIHLWVITDYTQTAWNPDPELMSSWTVHSAALYVPAILDLWVSTFPRTFQSVTSCSVIL